MWLMGTDCINFQVTSEIFHKLWPGRLYILEIFNVILHHYLGLV